VYDRVWECTNMHVHTYARWCMSLWQEICVGRVCGVYVCVCGVYVCVCNLRCNAAKPGISHSTPLYLSV
jgi:hypothetical protein